MNRFNMTRYAVTHPIGIVMIVLFFVTLGLYSYYRMGVELYPKINTPYVVVSVTYSGADAESVEQQITKPVEDALSSVSNVKHITSKSRTGRSQVTLELNFDADVDAAAVDASQKVNAIRKSLPDDADDPVVEKRDMDAAPILDLALVSSHPLDEMYSLADNSLVNDFTKADGVSDVELSGGRDREIAVKVDRDKLAYYGVSMDDIITALKRENKLAPAGSSYTDRRQTQIRLNAQYHSVEDIKKIHLTRGNGDSIPLTALGDVVREDKKVSRYARINGQDAIGISIYKNSNANLVSTSDGVMEVLEQMKKEYPDYQFIVVNDSAAYVRTALHNTLGTLVEGLFTTGLVLFLFLRGWRSAAAVMIAIPTSLIASFFAMYLAGFTFNMMSLMGMTLCIGILVDDSIVVLENIHRHLAKGGKAGGSGGERPYGNRHGGHCHYPLRCGGIPSYRLHVQHDRPVLPAVRPDYRLCLPLFPLHFLHPDPHAGLPLLQKRTHCAGYKALAGGGQMGKGGAGFLRRSPALELFPQEEASGRHRFVPCPLYGHGAPGHYRQGIHALHRRERF